jgi:peptidyl-prolyl cis-trans isomerase SurA
MAVGMCWSLIGGSLAVCAQQRRVLDRIVAVVDGALITQSDVDAAIALARINAVKSEASGQALPLRESMLQRLIEQKLIQREIRNYPGVDVLPEDVRAQLQILDEKSRAQGGLAGMASQWNTSLEEIEKEVQYQLRMDTFLDVRFRSFIRIDDDEVARYYTDKLPEILKKSGLDQVPPLETVKQQIRATLTEIRLQEELDRWIQELVKKADIQLFGENFSLAPKNRNDSTKAGMDTPIQKKP